MTAKVEQVDPLNLSYQETLQFADLTLQTFDADPLFNYWFGPDYRYGNRQLLFAYADCLLAFALDGMMFYTLRDAISGDLIGVSMWVPPVSAVREHSWKWRFQNLSIHLSLGLSYVWNWGIPNLTRRLMGGKPFDHPLYNDRLVKFYDGFNKVADRVGENDTPLKRLSELTYSQLATTPYRKKDMYYLSVFLIGPDHQRKGLGTFFLHETLNSLPLEPFQFSWKGKTSVGPAKVYVNASDAGCRLYKKLGFVDRCHYQISLDGYDISITRLEKNMGEWPAVPRLYPGPRAKELQVPRA